MSNLKKKNKPKAEPSIPSSTSTYLAVVIVAVVGFIVTLALGLK